MIRETTKVHIDNNKLLVNFVSTIDCQSLPTVCVKVLKGIDWDDEQMFLIISQALMCSVFIADILYEITYMNVEWNCSYDILAKWTYEYQVFIADILEKLPIWMWSGIALMIFWQDL